jgi:hypothetical protein
MHKFDSMFRANILIELSSIVPQCEHSATNQIEQKSRPRTRGIPASFTTEIRRFATELPCQRFTDRTKAKRPMIGTVHLINTWLCTISTHLRQEFSHNLYSMVHATLHAAVGQRHFSAPVVDRSTCALAQEINQKLLLALDAVFSAVRPETTELRIIVEPHHKVVRDCAIAS